MFNYDEYIKELEITNHNLKQALDKAIWWLNEIVENHRFTPISTAEKALAEIKQITESPAENVQSNTKSRPVNVQTKE